MEEFAAGEVDLAVAFYGSVADADARALLDFLIDHPVEWYDGAALARHLGFAQHRDVARATYGLGELAAGLGRKRPWREAQLGLLDGGRPGGLDAAGTWERHGGLRRSQGWLILDRGWRAGAATSIASPSAALG